MADCNLICGDCLEVMKTMEDGCVDLVITSPPYNLGNKHRTDLRHPGDVLFKHQPYEDDMPELMYQLWQTVVLEECARLLSPDGSLWYNHKNRLRGGIQIAPYEWLFQVLGLVIKQEVVWQNGGQNFDPRRIYPLTERVYWLAKHKDVWLENTIRHHDFFTASEWPQQHAKGKEHTRAFPVELPHAILRCFPDAKVVLDPFMGSGSTALACFHEERDFIGIELNEEYVKLAQKRLADARDSVSLLEYAKEQKNDN